MKDRPKSPVLTRRRFVTMVAAGSAAVMASPLAAATGSPTHPAPAKKHEYIIGFGDGPGSPEYERQVKSTADTLAVIRKHAMGPGTEMASVFRPLKSTRRSR